MAAEPLIAEAAPAKINLYLHVTGRREDGYHLLDSLVVFADIGDRIAAQPAETISLAYSGPFADALPEPEHNLVLSAARRLAEHFGINKGAALTLAKNLPVASGIGGGSADAAAAIRALIRLWGLPADDPGIMDIALSLGADVPVCLIGRPAVMRGIGEDLSLLSGFPSLPLVLVNPGVGVSTPMVFKARTGPFSNSLAWPADADTAASALMALALAGNDLQRPAATLNPKIGTVMAALEAEPDVRLARMSGSGATCFAITDSDATAAAVAAAVQARHPGWWVRHTTTF
ncbi:MAG: 4-(cytidine 5'-diphospho)-2-C-methyl-D-erythritol kinase [Rhodospirillales bacterium]